MWHESGIHRGTPNPKRPARQIPAFPRGKAGILVLLKFLRKGGMVPRLLWSTVRYGSLYRRLLLFCVVVVVLGAFTFTAIWFSLPDPRELQQRRPARSTQIYDRNGKLLYAVLEPDRGKYTPIPLERIPLLLRQATIATEDNTFYSHPGVEPRAILRALLSDLRDGAIVSGGSTLTQQLARNQYFTPEDRISQTLWRKIREAVLALRLEHTYSKDQLLQLYLNETFYGSLAHGIEAASQAFFGKHVWELDLAESALLAGLPQSPGSLNPFFHLEAAKTRQRTVLDLMERQGYITSAEAQSSWQEKLQLAPSPFPIAAPHFVAYVLDQLEQHFGTAAVARDGLQVTTTLDLDLQNLAESTIRYRLADLANVEKYGMDHNIHSAALLALAPGTGEILAMVGSPDYFDKYADGAFNGAIALRQPGSAFKPIVYATAFSDQRLSHHCPSAALPCALTAATVFNDVRSAFITGEGDAYVPNNYDAEFHGPMSLRDALATSNNVIAVKVLDAIGIPATLLTAHGMGISSLGNVDRLGLSLTLGGAEVSLLELSGAYATLADGGLYHHPHAITRVVDAQGHLLLEERGDPGGQVITPQVAYLLTHILSDNVGRIPAFGESSVLQLSRPAAAKTGTTSEFRDNWTLGYTPDLLAGVWVGNSDGTSMRNVSGISGAGPIWHDFMEQALRGRPPLDFAVPSGMEWREICVASGLLPRENCLQRRQELFIAGTEPIDVDQSYLTVRLDANTGLLAPQNCPGLPVVERVFRLMPPEIQSWARQHQIPEPPVAYAPCPSASGQQAQAPSTAGSSAPAAGTPVIGQNSAASLNFASPDTNATFLLSAAIPRSLQQVEVALQAYNLPQDVRVSLYIDNQLLGDFTNTSPGGVPNQVRQVTFRAWWQLQPGSHQGRAEAVDGAGNVIARTLVPFSVEDKAAVIGGGNPVN
ncbi:MAG: penicillin-binding protein [Chloroflexi bacterium]|nr:penicillin-binding protein [Chloroflexota bacterium]